MSVMIPSDEETVRMQRAVSFQMGKVYQAYAKKGRPLVVPPDIRRCMGHVANMMHRYRRRQYLHTSTEADSLGTLAEWLVKKFHDLNGTSPPPVSTYFRR